MFISTIFTKAFDPCAYLVELTIATIKDDLNSGVCAIFDSGNICSSEINREANWSLPALPEKLDTQLIAGAAVKIAEIVRVLECRDDDSSWTLGDQHLIRRSNFLRRTRP